MKNILLLLLAFCTGTAIHAQGNHTLPQKVYLYSLTEGQVIQYREGKFQAAEVIRGSRPVDSLDINKNSYLYLLAKRSFGYFLQVKYGSYGPELSMMLISPVQVSAYRFKDTWQVYLYDSTGFIKDFELKTNKKSFSVSAHCGCVEIDSKKLPKGALTVHYNSLFLVVNQFDFQAQSYGGGGGYKPPFRPFGGFRKKHMPFEPGFLVLNQSEYRHLDSLHAKAYLMDRKGRPYNGDVYVTIFAPYSNTFYNQTFPAKRLSDGAYSFDWQIPDSLMLDQVYTITFQAKNESAITKQSSFKVTYYNFINYKISISQNTYYLLPGDSAFIKISATDQNNIPLPGTKTELRFYLVSTGKLHVPLLSYPDSFYTNLMDSTLYLEPEKETWIKVPQKLLPYIDHGLYVHVKVTTPNSDIQEQVLAFQAVQVFEEYTGRVSNDSLHLKLLRNKRSVASDTVIIRMADRFFSEVQDYKTVLPHSVPNIDRYSYIYLLDTLGSIKYNYVPGQYSVAFEGVKTRDSLYLKFWNGSLYHLNWELYRKGKRFLTGNSDSLAMPLAGKEPIQVVYRYTYGSKMYYMQEVVVPATQALKIEHDLPSVAYPGQTIVAHVTVYDFDGKPVNNANLTGVSINSQMPVIDPPVIPYFPKIKGTNIPFSALNFIWPGYNYFNMTAGDTANYHQLDLKRFLHYRLYYSPDALHEERIPAPKEITALQVVINEAGGYQYPREIWVDGVIRYLIAGNNRQRNVIDIEPGNHKIAIRTASYFIEIDSVWCEKGKSNVLGINTLRLGENARLRYQTVQTGYEGQELEKIAKNVLLLNVQGRWKQSWIAQGNSIYEVPGPSIGMPGRYDRYTYYSPVAPLEEGMVTWFTKDTSFTFYFNPDQVYAIDSGKLVIFSKTHTMMETVQYAHTSGYFDSRLPLSMKELERQWFVEDSIADALKRRTPIVPVKRSAYGNQFQEYYGHSPYGGGATLHIQDGDKALVQRNFYWLENLKEPRYSLYIANGSTEIGSIKPGLYRLVTGSYQQEMMEIDSLVFDSMHHHFIRIDKLAKPLEPAHWAEMQYHYFLTLNKYGGTNVPIYDAYTIKQEAVSVSGSGEVNGTALIDLQPASYSYVLLIHQNGKNRYLATANAQGHFRMYDMAEGTYWVQIISPSRQVFFANQINLRKGSLLSLQLDCLTDTSLRNKISPHLRVRNFKADSAVYKDIEGKFADLHGRVYDHSAGHPLQSAQVRIMLNGIIVGGATTDENGDYHVCCLKPGKYQVEVILGGYESAMTKDVVLKAGKSLLFNQNLIQSEFAGNFDTSFMTLGNTTYLWNMGDASYFATSPSYAPMHSYESDGEVMYDMVEVQSAGIRKLNAVTTGAGRQKKQKENKDDGEGEEAVEEAVEGVEDGIDEKARLDEISRDPSGNKVRRDFRTNAFWIPNLITGKDGKTAFTYVLPDDQTQWINFLVAINRKQQTNLNTSYTRSYKPLSASLRVPEFVVIGDKITISGTVRNLVGDSLQIVIRETLDSIRKETTMNVGGYLRQNRRIEVKPGKDSLTLSYELQYNNYVDGEERKVKVLSNKVYDRKVQTRILGTGESIVIEFDTASVRRSIRVQSGLRDLLEEEIMNLKQYEYGCVEQSASKLYALLREKQLLEALGEKFMEQREVVAVIKRLENFQNSDGSWGWWKGSTADPSLTLYVSKALLLAEKEGFSAKGQKRGIGSLFNQYSYLSDDRKLTTLLLAQEMGMKYDFVEQVKVLAKKNLSKEGRMSLIELQIALKLSYDLNPVLSSLQQDAQGNYFMKGESSWGFNSHIITLTMQAYRVIRLDGKNEAILLSMRKFLFNNLSYVRRNTFERAAIINTLTEEIKAAGLGLFDVKLGEHHLYSGGSHVINGNSIKIENLGAGVSVIAIEEFESEAGTKQTRGVMLNTKFVDGKREGFRLQTGDVVRLQVEATVSEYQKYLVLNVPLPAGCTIISKPEAMGRETAREYFSDHVVIYFESLPKGAYVFEFSLLPQFEGELTLMPALMENMYAPEFFGREMRRTVQVVE